MSNLINENVFLDLCYPRVDKDSQIHLRDSLSNLIKDLNYTPYLDGYGNMYVNIGDSNTAFTSHLDNVDNSPLDHNLLDVKDGIVSVNSESMSTCLGADDAAGLYIMLTMILNGTEGMYCFFLDEEKGCLGSSYAAIEESTLFEGIDNMVSFDRKDYNSIITHQMGVRTCSEEFALTLCDLINDLIHDDAFKFAPDNTGSFTDSNSFTGIITNCTNVSVGYFNQHTKREYQDLNFLMEIAEVYSNIDWGSLPVVDYPKEDMYTFEEPNYEYYDYMEDIFYRASELVSENPDILAPLYKELSAILDKYEIEVDDPFYVGS